MGQGRDAERRQRRVAQHVDLDFHRRLFERAERQDAVLPRRRVALREDLPVDRDAAHVLRRFPRDAARNRRVAVEVKRRARPGRDFVRQPFALRDRNAAVRRGRERPALDGCGGEAVKERPGLPEQRADGGLLLLEPVAGKREAVPDALREKAVRQRVGLADDLVRAVFVDDVAAVVLVGCDHAVLLRKQRVGQKRPAGRADFHPRRRVAERLHRVHVARVRQGRVVPDRRIAEAAQKIRVKVEIFRLHAVGRVLADAAGQVDRLRKVRARGRRGRQKRPRLESRLRENEHAQQNAHEAP